MDQRTKEMLAESRRRAVASPPPTRIERLWSAARSHVKGTRLAATVTTAVTLVGPVSQVVTPGATGAALTRASTRMPASRACASTKSARVASASRASGTRMRVALCRGIPLVSMLTQRASKVSGYSRV